MAVADADAVPLQHKATVILPVSRLKTSESRLLERLFNLASQPHVCVYQIVERFPFARSTAHRVLHSVSLQSGKGGEIP
jgi:hypothetical protein